MVCTSTGRSRKAPRGVRNSKQNAQNCVEDRNDLWGHPEYPNRHIRVTHLDYCTIRTKMSVHARASSTVNLRERARLSQQLGYVLRNSVRRVDLHWRHITIAEAHVLFASNRSKLPNASLHIFRENLAKKIIHKRRATDRHFVDSGARKADKSVSVLCTFRRESITANFPSLQTPQTTVTLPRRVVV